MVKWIVRRSPRDWDRHPQLARAASRATNKGSIDIKMFLRHTRDLLLNPALRPETLGTRAFNGARVVRHCRVGQYSRRVGRFSPVWRPHRVDHPNFCSLKILTFWIYLLYANYDCLIVGCTQNTAHRDHASLGS